MKKYFIIIGLFTSFTIACEKAIDIDVPFEDPKLVLNGFLNPDSNFSVHLSKSQFVLDNSELDDITHAQVSVFQGNELLGELIHQELGFYELEGLKPEVGKIYTISAEAVGFPSVRAIESIPSSVNVRDIVLDSLGRDENDQLKLGVEFVLEDVAGQENYYLINVEEKGYRKEYFYNPNEPHNPDEEPEFTWEPFVNSLYLESTDPLVEEFCTGNFYSCGLLVKDTYFNGKPYRVKIITKPNYSHDPDYVKDVELNLLVTYVPESFYLYFKTLDINREASDNPFAEPAKVFSNVQGGYGIWSAINPISYRIK